MRFIERCKDFLFTPPRILEASPYELRIPDFNANPLIGNGANAYAFRQFQTLPVVNMLNGNGVIPGGDGIGTGGAGFFKPLGQNNLVALRPAGPKQDVIGIPLGETDLFTEPTEA